MDAAIETSLDFNSSAISRPSGAFVEIPEEFWAKAIKDENPIRVYSHNNNIALVLAETETKEEGLYIRVPFSSDIPQNNDEISFTTIIKDYVYKFIKKMG